MSQKIRFYFDVLLLISSILLAELSIIRPSLASSHGNLRLIDTHVHFVGSRKKNFSYSGSVKSALKLMNRFGIKKSIVMPPPQVDAVSIYNYKNLKKAVAQFPNRFAFQGGGGSLNKILHRHANINTVTKKVKQTFERTAKNIAKSGAVGFGEIAGLHISAAPRHPYEYVPADHPLLKLLADIAAKEQMPIELHMDAVRTPIPPPERFSGNRNPTRLPQTLDGLDRLLSHNQMAIIVWAHGGSDPVGSMTPKIISGLMDKHSNLYVSLRVVGGRAPLHNKLYEFGNLNPDWLELLNRHSDRFVIGTDSFYVADNRRGQGPGFQFARRNQFKLRALDRFLTLLPEHLVRKITHENAERLYNFDQK